MNAINKTVFTITIRHFQFQATFIPLIITLIAFGALVALGLWQLERAEYKEKLEQMIAERSQQAPISLALAPTKPQDRLYLPVKVSGYYDNKHHLLLDNRVHNMQAGYDLYTPLKLTPKHGILVHRGWLPLEKNRQTLPNIKTDTKQYFLTGILQNTPTTNALGIQIKENYTQWPLVVQSINLNEIEQQIGYTLEPNILTLFKSAQSDFAQDETPITLNMSSDRHIGYAITWFLCAFVLLLLFIFSSTHKHTENNYE